MRLPVLLLIFSIGCGLAQQYDTSTTPVPILKQINRHNEDGSYSYGYEAADGSYKIESKHPNGEVFGKYGFIDDTGSVREVEYGATRSRGFEPAGTGINVPPSVTGNSINTNEPEDDGQYREDPSVYYTDPRYTNGERYDPVPKNALRQQQVAYQQRQQLAYQPQALQKPQQPLAYQPQSAYQHPAYEQQIAYQPSPVSKSVASPAYQQPAIPANSQAEYRPQYRNPYQRSQYQQQYDQPAQSVAQPQSIVQRRYEGPLATNSPSNLGSYSVHYKR